MGRERQVAMAALLKPSKGAVKMSKATLEVSATLAVRKKKANLGDRQDERLFAQIPTKMDFVNDPSFSSVETEDKLFGASAPEITVPWWTHFPEVPEDIPTARGAKTRLSGREEVTMFLRYNYARCRLSGLIERNCVRTSAGRRSEMVLWYKRAMDARAELVRANMALVLAMAKRTRIPNVEFSELVSEGNMALLRSVEKFDVSRGFKFSTYACRAILKSFNRMATKTGRYRKHFPTEFDPELERSDYDVRKHEMQSENVIDTLREILSKNRADLSEVERTVVLERFALASRGQRKTLSEVGKIVGLTNERVRQIQLSALRKLREALNDESLVA